MPSFTVTSEAEQLRTYESQKAGGTLVVWAFDLEGQGTVELHKKPGNEPPKPSTVVLGNVKEHEFDGQPVKRLYLDKPNPNGAGRNGGGRAYDDPKTIARISRSHSQEMAIRLIAAAGDADELDLSNREVTGAYLNEVVRPLVDWFDRDKDAAGKRAGGS